LHLEFTVVGQVSHSCAPTHGPQLKHCVQTIWEFLCKQIPDDLHALSLKMQEIQRCFLRKDNKITKSISAGHFCYIFYF